MPTEALATRTFHSSSEDAPHGLLISLSGHVLALLIVVGATWLAHRIDPHWGEPDPTVGSIQATMVNALPLPPRLYKEKEVLASDKMNIAPTLAPTPPPSKTPVSKAKPDPPPKQHEIALPSKSAPQPLTTRKITPNAVLSPHRRAPSPPTPKAATGDSSGVQIPQSVTNLKNGTATITVEERAFGDRYAYYIRLISQKVDAAKQEQGLDPPDAKGKRAAVRFTINRDGVPTDPQIVTRSGSPGLDINALRTIQRIDSFGPLPAGDHLTVIFGFSDEQ